MKKQVGLEIPLMDSKHQWWCLNLLLSCGWGVLQGINSHYAVYVISTNFCDVIRGMEDV